jgi:hypothetical protein
MNTNLTEEEKFVIFWLYNKVAKSIPTNPFKTGCDEIVVDGINITRVVGNLLQDRLFI